MLLVFYRNFIFIQLFLSRMINNLNGCHTGFCNMLEYVLYHNGYSFVIFSRKLTMQRFKKRIVMVGIVGISLSIFVNLDFFYLKNIIFNYWRYVRLVHIYGSSYLTLIGTLEIRRTFSFMISFWCKSLIYSTTWTFGFWNSCDFIRSCECFMYAWGITQFRNFVYLKTDKIYFK